MLYFPPLWIGNFECLLLVRVKWDAIAWMTLLCNVQKFFFNFYHWLEYVFNVCFTCEWFSDFLVSSNRQNYSKVRFVCSTTCDHFQQYPLLQIQSISTSIDKPLTPHMQLQVVVTIIQTFGKGIKIRYFPTSINVIGLGGDIQCIINPQ